MNTYDNVKVSCSCMPCSIGHLPICIQARPRQHHERMRNECMLRFGGLYFFQGGTLFHQSIHREIFIRVVRENNTHILQIKIVIPAAIDLLEFFKIIKAHHHLKTAL